MRRSKILTILLLAATAAIEPSTAHAAFINGAGTGWATFESDFQASFRHVKSNAADFEIGLGTSSAGYDVKRQGFWNRGANTFEVSFDGTTGEVSVSLNDSSATWLASGAPGQLLIQLIARNQGSNGAELALRDLTFNDQPLQNAQRAAAAMTASSMSGTGAPSDATWLTLTDLPRAGWTLAGAVDADWSGAAPQRSYTRLDFGFKVPEPGPMGVLAVIGAVSIIRRRRAAIA